MGQASIGGKDYWTLNPPRKERKEKVAPEPKDEIIYRNMFILRPVYQTHDAKGWLDGVRFLGYILIVRESGHYWKQPRKLAEVKKHADLVYENVRASEAIVRTFEAIGENQRVAA